MWPVIHGSISLNRICMTGVRNPIFMWRTTCGLWLRGVGMAKYEQRQVLSYSALTRFYLRVKSKGEQPQIGCETMTYYNHNPSLQRAMDITVTQVWQRYYLPYARDGAVSAPSFRRWVTAGTKYSCLAAGSASRAIHYLQCELMISIASVYSGSKNCPNRLRAHTKCTIYKWTNCHK